MSYKVGYFIGSLSSTSINRLLAKALIRLAPGGLSFHEISFRDLSLYTPDLDANPPLAAQVMKAAIVAADALLIVTPEYNRSIPGGLKNAFDWASRPDDQNSLAKKPSATIGASPGGIGTAVAQQHLRGLLAHGNSPQMNAPEAFIQFKPGLITEDGHVTVAATEKFLRTYIEAFHSFVDRQLRVLPATARRPPSTARRRSASASRA